MILKKMANENVIRLPKFNGIRSEWPEFKRICQETSNKYQLTPLQSFMILDEALDGEAAKCVAGIMLGASYLPKIMERLEVHFGTAENMTMTLDI